MKNIKDFKKFVESTDESHCKTCGAPKKIGRKDCQYCGVIYDKDEIDTKNQHKVNRDWLLKNSDSKNVKVRAIKKEGPTIWEEEQE